MRPRLPRRVDVERTQDGAAIPHPSDELTARRAAGLTPAFGNAFDARSPPSVLRPHSRPPPFVPRAREFVLKIRHPHAARINQPDKLKRRPQLVLRTPDARRMS
jgi:hypothetical protein